MKAGFALTLVCGSLLALPAGAADVISATAPEATPVLEDRWTFSVTPYFWAAGISGETQQFGVPIVVDIDSDFSDIWDNLDFAAMAIAEARYGRFSVYGDLIYTKLGAESSTPFGILAEDVEVTATTFAGLAAAGYSVLEGPSGRLDIVGGVRVWSVETKISFDGGLLDGASVDDSASWVDGVVGLRGNYFFTPKFYFAGWGLIGAGGADVDWDVAAGLGYRFNDTLSATVGYRAMGVDYSNDDGFLFDVVQQGPIMGLTINF